jgi:hypothetical protein
MQNFSVSLAPSRLDQVINPWTWNLFTINLGQSSDPKLERRILDEVGTYGRQIGQIGDALGVLVSLMTQEQKDRLDEVQLEALGKLEDQLRLIELIKQQRRLEARLGFAAGASAPAAQPAASAN